MSRTIINSVEKLGNPQAIIIPGTKSTMADLHWLHETGLADEIIKYANNGGEVVRICGGYQMLGQSIHDPHHVESKNDSTEGLGLLPTITTFAHKKATYQVRAKVLNFASITDEMIQGYEIHMGETQSQTQWLEIVSRSGEQVKVKDGSVSPNGKVWGCYIHGLFANDSFRHVWFTRLGWRGVVTSQATRFEQSLEKLADTVEDALNMELLEKIIWTS